MKNMILSVCIVFSGSFAGTSFAHHSNAEYDRSGVIELEGEITRVIWRNPHVGLWVAVTNESGERVIWRMEAADLLGTQRRGVHSGTFQTGQQVKFAGYSSTRRMARMLVTNVLLPDDTEVLLTGNARPIWSEKILGGGNWAVAAKVGSAYQDLGIFRVWTLDRTSRPPFSDNPPLTESARQEWEQYDSYDDPALQCANLGMPRVMTVTGPHPVAFVDQGDVILLLGEYFDVERKIHMASSVNPASIAFSPLGYSTGHWEGESLVVNTSRVNYPLFDISGLAGIPQTTNVSFEERFTLNNDETELHYDIRINDQNSFTETLVAEDYAVWKWRPEIEIMPYLCEVD